MGSSAIPDRVRRDPSSSRGSSASSTAATTRPGSPSSTTPATCSSRSGPASWPTSRRRSPTGRPHAAIGLAHTRWATHGRPNDLNAHPHQDCTGEITVIHNGIIENFRELRDGLEARGHTLTSETDTEAIAHLIEEAYAGDLADAVRAALRKVHGAYALAVMHRGEPDRLVGARMDVPLVVGVGDGETFLASDVAAILAHTDRVIFLEEGDVADLRPSGVTITGIDGAPRERAVSIDRLDARGRREGRLRALHAQGDARAADGAAPGASPAGSRPTTGSRSRSSPSSARTLRTVDRVELVACGTAYYASLVGAAAIQDWVGIPARANIGSEFRYSPPPLDERTLVIAVTQSGETADTIAPTRLARERGCPIIAVTNTVGSAITREAEAVLFLQAGPEIAVAASKTFVTQVTTLVILAAAIAKARGRLGRRAGARARSGAAAPARSRPRPRSTRSGRRAATWPGATSTRAASCSSGAATPIRPPSRARSSSRRSATSTPRAMRPAS